MDLKVMPSSNREYNYLLVMRCNKEVVEAIFQNLICAHGTNISKIYCDLDTCFKNEIMDIMTCTLGIKVNFAVWMPIRQIQLNVLFRSLAIYCTDSMDDDQCILNVKNIASFHPSNCFVKHY